MLLRTAFVCAASFAALTTAPVLAQTPPAEKPAEKPAAKAATLGVGDDAPPIAIAKWVKGEPVASFQKGKTYVVEFWAPWCPPCVAGMPHLSELQKTYGPKGLTIIGVSGVDSRGNTLEKVEKMVADKGDKMAYTVAFDDGSKTTDAYMRAAKQGGIPCCFLVDGDGKIAYIGHPGQIDETLAKVVEGKHDIQAMIAEQKKAKENDAKAGMLQEELNRAINGKDWEAAVRACDEVLALDAKKYLGAARAKFEFIAVQIKDMDRANAWAKSVHDGIGKDTPEILNALAWMMVDPELKLEKRDVELALKLSQRATELTKEKDASTLDTLARVWFTKGDPAKAVEIQKKAVELEPRLGTDALKEYEEALAKRG